MAVVAKPAKVGAYLMCGIINLNCLDQLFVTLEFQCPDQYLYRASAEHLPVNPQQWMCTEHASATITNANQTEPDNAARKVCKLNTEKYPTTAKQECLCV